MSEPSEKYKDVTFLLDRYGVTLAMTVFLAWVLTHQLKDIKKQLDRCVSNERAIMTKIGIPFIVEADDKK